MSLQLAAALYIYIYITVQRKGQKSGDCGKGSCTRAGSVQRFKFAGRLEFLAGQWVI